jgi:hypothetical protein
MIFIKFIQLRKVKQSIYDILRIIDKSVLLYCKIVPQFRLLVAVFPPRRLGFWSRSGHVAFVVAKVTPEQVFSEYFGFPFQFLFHRLFHTHHLSSFAGTIDQLVFDIPSGLSLTPPRETKREKICMASPQ